MKDIIIARLREPSTYAGIAGVVGGLTFIPHASSVSETILAVGTAIVSLLGIWLPEQKAS